MGFWRSPHILPPSALGSSLGALWISCAMVFHRNVRGICPTNQVSVVLSLLREAVCLKTKDLQVAGLQAVWRPLYPSQPACFWNSGDLGHLCLYQAIWSWSGVFPVLQSIVQSALASTLPVCEDTASLLIWPFRLPLLEALPIDIIHVPFFPFWVYGWYFWNWSCAVRIDSVQFTSFFQFSFQTFENSSYKLRRILCHLLGYVCHRSSDVAVPWCSTCLICTFCFQQFCQSWVVCHPPGLFTHKACTLQASTVCSRHAPLAHRASHHVHVTPWGYAFYPFIFPARCTPRRLMKKVSPLLDLLFIHITRRVEVMQCFFQSFLSNLWWDLVPTYRLQLWKQMARRTACDQQGLFTVYQLVKEFHVRCLVEVPVFTIFLCLTKDLQRTLASAYTAVPAP